MKSRFLLFLIIAVSFIACTAVTLTPANFAWPIESVLTTDTEGKVIIDRYSTEFNASNLFIAELGDTADYANKELRVIRNHLGNYVMTAKNFMSVYVFKVNDGAFEKADKIFITKDGLNNPALNQRDPNIELIDGDKSFIINSKGTVR